MKSWTIIASILALAGVAVSQKKSCTIPRKPVTPEKLRNSVELKTLKCHAEAFCKMANESPNYRLAGSAGYNATASYIVEQLESYGDYYDIERQPFSNYVEYFNEGRVIIDGEETVAATMQFSRNATLEGRKLIWVNSFGCNGTEDFPPEVEGNIALMSRGPQGGTCMFATKSANAGAAGAAGLIIFDYVPGAPPFAGVLSAEDPPEGPMVPTSSISNELGLALSARLRANETITVDRFYTATNGAVLYSQNIIATTTGGNPDNILFVGAHLDSVAEGPGMNDNGSGSIAILEVASRLARYTTNSTVRFAWWTAEEAGLLGSTHYVETADPEELLKVRLYLNFDMVASGNGILGVYDGSGSAFGLVGPPGSGEAQMLYEEYFASQDLPLLPVEFNGRSDYGPFLAKNVPSGGLFTGADDVKTDAEAAMFGGTAGLIHDVNYHSPYDTIGNWSYHFLELNTRAIAHSVAVYGASFEGFPEREPPATELTVRGSAKRAKDIGACSRQAAGTSRFRSCNVAYM